jgi:hypothetical protein
LDQNKKTPVQLMLKYHQILDDENYVHIYLDVFLAKQGMVDYVAAPTGDEAVTYLSDLVKNEVPFYV